MQNFLPGTKIEASLPSAESVLSSIFLAGGLVLSQISSVTGIELHTVQNWVKRKYISPPVNKKYSKRQFCRIVIINILKDVLPIDSIVFLLSYINGQLDDEGDDMVDDGDLYIYFLRLLSIIDGNFDQIDLGIHRVLENYYEPYAGTRKRLEDVLRIMATAYASATLKQETLFFLSRLDNNLK